MALSSARILSVGETPYAHERAGIDFAEKALPDTDPYHLWALVDLLDPSTGRLLEVDMVILGYSCLYLVELKDWPGKISGNSVDWLWETPEGRQFWRDNPRSLARRKAQVLKSRLERAFPRDVRVPWVEPLIFLSNPDVRLGLEPDGLIGVVRRNNFVDAITRHDFVGAEPNQKGRAIDRPTLKATVKALEAIGFRKRKGKRMVGSFELGELLDETQSFQDRTAVHSQIKGQRRRARTYLVPEQTSIERRQLLLRAAEREANLLNEVREHPNILRYTDYVADAPLGPTVLFDDFDGGVPLDAFLRVDPGVTFDDRIAILEQVANALGHCHRREIVHGGLCPSAVLVRRGPDNAVETRLCNFQLGGSQNIEATSHWSALGTEAWAVYQAPELRRDPTQRTIEGDLFSVGAIGYLLLTGKPPGNTVAEVEARMNAGRCLDPRDASNALPDQLAEAIAFATMEVVAQRANDVAFWIDVVIGAATAPVAPTEPEPSPLDARKDDKLGALTVVRVLGHGASSRVLEVTLDDASYALKVSLGAEHDERMAAEAEVLAKLRHPRVVRLEKALTIAGRPCLLMSLAGQSLQRKLSDDGTPSLDYACRWGADLLMAVEHLEDEGVLHRDIKPANVGVGTLNKRSQSLTLFDFSLAGLSLTNFGIGTAAYRDPHLAARGSWDAAADRYSAAVTMYELVTGQRPVLDHGNVTLAAERFEASVRGALVEFFHKAFVADATQRHASAALMRRDWERAFEAQASVHTAEDEPPPAPLTDTQIASFQASTPIQVLPLSNRAKNALDRAGILCVSDLVDLPPNQLSVIRGVGRTVAKEILDLRERWMQLVGGKAAAIGPRFFPGYRGADLMAQFSLADLPSAATDALADAGLRTLALIAGATKTQVAALARRHAFDVAKLSSALAREHAAAQARDRPTTIETWIEALLPPTKKALKNVRALYGLGDKAYSGVRELAAAVAETPLAELTPDRLIRVAASASRTAAASSRLEMYPRQMDARRAVELSASIIPARIHEDKLRELIAARYPDASPLPPRPALDDLLETANLVYFPDEAIYGRRGEERTSLHTSMTSYTRISSVPRGPDVDARNVTIQEFEDQVRICLDRRALLVVGVSADRAYDAERALAHRFPLTHRSFDAVFLAELDRQVRKLQITEDLVYTTDLQGSTSPDWHKLIGLAKLTAGAVATELFPPKAPLLITQPGLIDRYQLTDFLDKLVAASRDDDSSAIILLVPGNDGGVPIIGDTPISDLLPGQHTSIPKAWIGANLETA
ncbi:MAG: protein kinase [Proteobacteria bacterium]|nr:protein kinase [Pseudomonadota bacterium]